MSVSLGPVRFLSFSGGLDDLAAGKERSDALKDLDDRLPQPNSLRRAGEDTKAAVLAASELLKSAGLTASERIGIYVGQQQIALDYCSQFIQTSYRQGPKLASPMYFAESVANNVATHLSLTLGLRGTAQTFIGTRVAGIQSLMAAMEDVEGGLVETGLVVVLGVATGVTRDAYQAVFQPFARRGREEVKFLRGALAMLVRKDAAGEARILFAGVRCLGRKPRQQINAVGSLWTEAEVRMPAGSRMLDSTLVMARSRSQAVIRRVGETTASGEGLGECYALDPFARLLLDGARHPGPAGRGVLCLGEEGTVGILGLDGPLRIAGSPV